MIQFASRQIGDGSPCFVTFEAGPTHDGLETAKRLVSLAAEAGADAVKFQMLDPDYLVADKTLPFTYSILKDRGTGELEEVTESLYDILCRRVLMKDEWKTLKVHCDKLGMPFFATALKEEEIDFLAELGCDSVKIASGDVNHFPLIRRAAQTGMCIQLDTGSATLGEVEEAVDVIRSEGNENIIIHHCPSGYPARLEGINLNVIKTLKAMFNYPIAFSDHTPGAEMDIAAVSLGANMVEKTITLDRTTRSVEHAFSLEPRDMSMFIQTIRDLETALGAERRILHDEEREKRKAVRRSAYLAADAKAGTTLADLEIEFRRPGYGIEPKGMGSFVGASIARDLPAGHCLSPSDFSWN